MPNTNNNILMTLAIINVLGLIVILFLVWMLWNNNPQLKDQNITVTYVPEHPPATVATTLQKQINDSVKTKQSVNAKDQSRISAVAKEVISNNLDTYERLEISVPKPSQRTDNKTDSATNGILSDDEYIAVFNQLKTKQATVKKDYSREDVSRAQSIAQIKKSANDHFNKVDISQLKKTRIENLTLAQEVATLATVDERPQTETTEPDDSWRDYLRSLKDAEKERQNEMRNITVQRGDTLWKISTRAYGSGYSYKKIFEANPHLTSPDSITVGEILRVPL